MSLDGYVTGPDPRPEAPLGDGGEQLHDWVTRLASWRARHGLEGGETGPDDELLAATWTEGASVMGRGMLDAGEGPWGDDPPFRVPVFVVTHRERPPLVKGETTFTFVTDGVESAVAQARAAAQGRDVAVAGGADVARQCLAAGLLDEVTIHLVPIALGGGVRLFDAELGACLEPAEAIAGDGVTHLRYRVAR